MFTPTRFITTFTLAAALLLTTCPTKAQVADPKDSEQERLAAIMSPNADAEGFRQEYLAYLSELGNSFRLLNEIKAVRDKFDHSGLKPSESLDIAKKAVTGMSADQIVLLRGACAKFPGWRDGSKTLGKVLSPAFLQELESRAAQTANRGLISQEAATTDSCADALSADISNTDISIAKALEIAGEALMEALPTDALTFEAHATAGAARALLQVATLALETLKATKDDCQGDSFQTAIKQQVTDTKNAIINNDNANKLSIINNDNANELAIINNASSNKTEIVNAVNAAKTTIINNDNANTTSIINNDNANTLTITNSVNNAKSEIIINANANKDELVRLAIAADLSAVDSATPVGYYMLPAVDGGYLELTRSIVVHAITKLAGSSSTQANSFLAQGDTFKAAGSYKKAYTSYRKAYKAAVN